MFRLLSIHLCLLAEDAEEPQVHGDLRVHANCYARALHYVEDNDFDITQMGHGILRGPYLDLVRYAIADVLGVGVQLGGLERTLDDALELARSMPVVPHNRMRACAAAEMQATRTRQPAMVAMLSSPVPSPSQMT